ncbi:MAG: hypothetical protein HC788_08095 [Sphingopyxis sp.]|nr:hypothetical protein [Sphingopyxis sp.]
MGVSERRAAGVPAAAQPATLCGGSPPPDCTIGDPITAECICDGNSFTIPGQQLTTTDIFGISSLTLVFFGSAVVALEQFARSARLSPGPLTARAPLGELWLDGGHNVDAAKRIADHFARDLADRGPIDLIIGMLANKDAAGFLTALAPVTRNLVAVPVPGQAHFSPEALTALARDSGIKHFGQATDIATALGIVATLARKQRPARGVAITGSLYLAGAVLRLNDEVPD